MEEKKDDTMQIAVELASKILLIAMKETNKENFVTCVMFFDNEMKGDSYTLDFRKTGFKDN